MAPRLLLLEIHEGNTAPTHGYGRVDGRVRERERERERDAEMQRERKRVRDGGTERERESERERETENKREREAERQRDSFFSWLTVLSLQCSLLAALFPFCSFSLDRTALFICLGCYVMSLRRQSTASSFRFNSEIMASRKMILDLETFQTFFETHADTLRRGGLKPISDSPSKRGEERSSSSDKS